MNKIALEGEFLPIFLEEFTVFESDRFSVNWIDEQNGIQAIYGLKKETAVPTVFALLFMRAKDWTKEKASEWLGQHPEYLPRKLGETVAIIKGKKILRLLRSPMPFIPEFYKLQTVDEDEGIYSILGITFDSSLPRVVALLFNGKQWNGDLVNEWLETRQGDVFRESW